MSCKDILASLFNAIKEKYDTSELEDELSNKIDDVSAIPEFADLPLDVIKRIISHAGPLDTSSACKALATVSSKYGGDTCILLKNIRLHDTSLDSLAQCFASIKGSYVCEKMKESGVKEVNRLRRHIVHLEREIVLLKNEIAKNEAIKDHRRKKASKEDDIQIIVETKSPSSPKVKVLRNGVEDAENIFDCIRKGNFEKAKQMCKNDSSCFTMRGNRSRTPLMYCANYGREDIAKFLIEMGSDIELRDSRDNTALHIAASAGHLGIVDLLCRNKANMEAKNALEQTPLIAAIMNSQTEVATYLIKRKANIEEVDRNGNTPLLAASQWGQLPIIEALVAAGANIEARDKEGNTSIMYAARCAFLDVVEFFIEKGADVTKTNNNGKTAVDLAYTIDIKRALQAAKKIQSPKKQI